MLSFLLAVILSSTWWNETADQVLPTCGSVQHYSHDGTVTRSLPAVLWVPLVIFLPGVVLLAWLASAKLCESQYLSKGLDR